MHAQFDLLIARLVDACRAHYGARLVAVAVFGSAGRGAARPDSDVDLLIVADSLPNGRVARARDFDAVEDAVRGQIKEARAVGLSAFVSPVFKTPGEIDQGSPLLLDMIDDARLLYDRAGFLRGALTRFKARLSALGAKRIWKGNAWVWDLKPDYTPGEVFEL